ncbi:single-stranded DNA-binding protein [Streptacidiphilus fuscans]|uniref:Single-stranded DNA-binding protein n=1 Tax=Streptacidiphilus fuscans TaxID=2789292 RepID=A0A931B3L0_9ACTN|nr:single-stranded DNA-binding protein [Streptacidiphilus fuscans]MBF9070484.1 single-stranded DNA-binding protein [Streptacidiphilus fuscans]
MMMNGAMVTLVGVAVSQVRYSTTQGGVPVAHFRLAATERRFDRPRQVWVEGDTSFFTVWAWRSLAENALTSIGCGDPVLVTGRMRIREWDRTDGRPKGVAAEIEAMALGHDLVRGTTIFHRTVRGRPELVASRTERARMSERPQDQQAADQRIKETTGARQSSGARPGPRPNRPATQESRASRPDGPVTPVLTLAALDRRSDGTGGPGGAGGAGGPSRQNGESSLSGSPARGSSDEAPDREPVAAVGSVVGAEQP